MTVQKADGASVHESTPLSAALQAAGFSATPARAPAAGVTCRLVDMSISVGGASNHRANTRDSAGITTNRSPLTTSAADSSSCTGHGARRPPAAAPAR